MKIRSTSILLLIIMVFSVMIGCSNKSGTSKSNENKKPITKNQDDKNHNSNNNNHDDNNNSIPSEKLKVIVIDPGHGGTISSAKEPVSPGSKVLKPKNVAGAEGIKTRISESYVALDISKRLKKILLQAGYKVIMTRNSQFKTIGNIARAKIGNKDKADLVIRIHADSSLDNSINGASMLVPGDVGYAKSISDISKKYGEIILKALVSTAKMKDRGIVTRNDLTGFNWSRVPVVLIETGFLSNVKEDSLLSTAAYRQKIADGLATGIKRAIDSNK